MISCKNIVALFTAYKDVVTKCNIDNHELTEKII